MHALGGCSIVFEPIAGGGIADVTASVLSRPHCSTMLISIFGNGLERTRHQGLENLLIPLLQAVRSKSDRAVFFIGGFAAKYDYPPVFDENMDRIRRFLHIGGAVVVDGAHQVAKWSLAPDLLHFSSVNKPEMVQFWFSSLQLAKPLPAVRCTHVVAWAPTDLSLPPARTSQNRWSAKNAPQPPQPPPLHRFLLLCQRLKHSCLGCSRHFHVEGQVFHGCLMASASCARSTVSVAPTNT